MNKYLVTIEFRYVGKPRFEDGSTSFNREITIGVYDTFDQAANNGNNLLKKLENKFDLHVFPDGRKAKKERFSKNGGAFGGKRDLISNSAYLKTPFTFYVKITTLKYGLINLEIDNVIDSVKEYKTYKEKQEM